MAPRPETDPKNASDRRPKPDGELERYGVWIKAEPQDVIEDADLGAEDKEGGQPLSGDAFLTDEEERLLGSFEEIGSELPEGQASSGSKLVAAAPSPLEDFADLPPLEDFDIPADFGGMTGKTFGEAAPIDFDPSTIDISLEEMDEAGVGPGPTGFGSDGQPLHGKSPSYPASSGRGSGMAELVDVSADFLDLEDGPSPSLPKAVSARSVDDVTAEFLDLEDTDGSSGNGKHSATESEFESLDIDLTFDDTLPPEKESSGREAGFEKINDIDHVLDGGKSGKPEGFDDVAAVERDLGGPPAVPAPAAVAMASPAASLSNELLMKIAEELASIRGELVALKRDFSAGRVESPPGSLPPPLPDGAPVADATESAEDALAGGFFDEEDDEKITLNIDELENILNTADFKEEEVSPEAAPFDESPLAGQLEAGSLLDESILPDSGIYATPPTVVMEPAIEEVFLPGEEMEPAELPAEKGESDGGLLSISTMAEEGVMPMTPPPEDTSYLEQPLPSEDIFDLEESPLDEAPLVEPDLSDIDIPLEELSPEVSDELPLVEDLEELPDISLDIHALHDESVPLELEPESTIQEIEEVGFADLDLHHEGQESSEEAELEPLPDFGESLLDETLEAVDEIPGMEEFELPGESMGPEPFPVMEEIEVPESFELVEDVVAKAPLPHPDEFSSSLDDSLFVGNPARKTGATGTGDSHAGGEVLYVASSAPTAARPSTTPAAGTDSANLKTDIRKVLSYLDKLLESLPEEKIEEFAKSEHFETYKKLFEELGLV